MDHLPYGGVEVTPTSSRTLLALTVLCLVLTGNYGCTGCISPCLLAPSVTIGSSAGQAGVSRYERGKIVSFELARYEHVVEATRRAGDALSLQLQKQASNGDQTTLEYVDGQDKQIKVFVERRTATLTYIWIDVGLFGPKGLALVMLNQIIHEIGSASHYLQGWTHQEVM